MSNLKEGDSVKIKSIGWYNANKGDYGSICGSDDFISTMAKYCGQTATITYADDDDSYRINLDNGLFWWRDYMFEDIDNVVIKQTKFNKYNIILNW